MAKRKNDITQKNAKKRKKRIKQTAEVFTPNDLVNEMLDELPKEVWTEDEENTFLDPTCGNGNFLIWTLARKLSKGHNPTEALKTIYGLDIKRDNIKECRLRLLKVLNLFSDITEEHIKTVILNVRTVNTSKYPRGSLDYDMSFKKNYTQVMLDGWFKKIQHGELDKVEITAIEELFYS